MSAKHRPYRLYWWYVAFTTIFFAYAAYALYARYRIIEVSLLCGLYFLISLIGLLLMQSVEVKNDAVVVASVFGLRKRLIPLGAITAVVCRTEGFREGNLPFLYIYFAKGKSCRIHLGTFERHSLLVRDINSHLACLKQKTTQSVPGYPPQGVGSPEP